MSEKEEEKWYLVEEAERRMGQKGPRSAGPGRRNEPVA